MLTYTIKVGEATLDKKLTIPQAHRYGLRTMPLYLRKSGFRVVLYKAAQEINGWDGVRIGYCK